MYTNSSPNVILMTDCTDAMAMQKTVGVYKVAYELRQIGIQVAVIHHLNIFSIEEINSLLTKLISPSTLFVGFNNVFYQPFLDSSASAYAGIKSCPPGSMLPHGLQFNKELKLLIKEANTNCQLVLGGPTAHDASYNGDFDYIVSGYADKSIVNLAKHLMDKSIKLEQSYKSIHGPYIINDSKAAGFDFPSSTIRYEEHDAILPDEVLTLEVSRGCIFKCSFCSFPLNGKSKFDYIKNEELLLAELMDNYTRFGTTKYVFSDDTFNDSIEKCEMISRVAAALPFKLEWWAYLRLDLLAAHPQTIDMLFDSGLRGCYFGIETFNQKAGSAIGKGAKRERLIDTLRLIKTKWGASVMLHGSFIFGLPHESMESMKQTISFLLGPDCPLDSWNLRTLVIKADSVNWVSGFLSDIDINYEKYGYEKVGTRGTTMVWKNEFCDSVEIDNMIKIAISESEANGKRVSCTYAFWLSGLGFELSTLSNKYIHEIDWKSIRAKRKVREQEYKHKLYTTLRI